MVWQIEVDDVARKQLAKLDKPVAKRIIAFLRQRLSQLENPRNLGAALQGAELGNYWKYRVGDYRVIAKINDDKLIILILKMGNRKEVYR